MSKYDVRKHYKVIGPDDYASPNAPTESEVLKARKLRNLLWVALAGLVIAVMTVLFFTVPNVFWLLTHILLIASGIAFVIYVFAVAINATYVVSETFQRARVYGVKEDE